MISSKWSGVLAFVAAAGIASWALVDSAPAYGQPVKVPKKEKDKKDTKSKDSAKKKGAGVSVGDTAPDWTVTGVDGKEHKLSDFRGKIVLMDFWATWCPPCRAAMPGMQKIHEEYKDKGVVVLGMNCWERGDPKAFMESNKYTYGLMLKSDAAAEAYGVNGIPAFFLIGPDGKVLMVERGFAEDGEKKIASTIDKHLSKEKSDAPAKPTDDAAAGSPKKGAAAPKH
ncbi:MAG: TlpA family protein disulfide reductase [Phycisphaeraceae bacterium]|nr:TlpA family protein disulfide reductase [Phycisphaeraceae bacterium]